MELSQNIKNKVSDPTMYISYISQDVKQSYSTLVWAIKKYYELKADVLYDFYANDVNCHMSLKKEKGCVKIYLRSHELVGNITCSLVCGKRDVVCSVSAMQIANGEYEVVFPSAAIKDAKNGTLKEGHLLISFKFNEKSEIKNLQAGSAVRKCQSDQIKLAKDLLVASIKSKCSNFTIKTDDKEVSVPKALLAARSEFFKEYQEEKDSITVDADYESVCAAVRYLYSGALPVFKELEDIYRLMKVAKILKIKNLQLKCVHLAEESHKQSKVRQTAEGGAVNPDYIPS